MIKWFSFPFNPIPLKAAGAGSNYKTFIGIDFRYSICEKTTQGIMTICTFYLFWAIFSGRCNTKLWGLEAPEGLNTQPPTNRALIDLFVLWEVQKKKVVLGNYKIHRKYKIHGPILRVDIQHPKSIIGVEALYQEFIWIHWKVTGNINLNPLCCLSTRNFSLTSIITLALGSIVKPCYNVNC